MSKKSRRRNRRLLTALAALGGAAMLAGRGKKPNMDIPDRNRGMMPTGIDKVIEDVSVSTPKTIQDSQVLGRMRGNVTAGGGFPGQSKRANYANRMRNLNADINRNNMLRAIRSGAPVRQADPISEFDQTQDFGFGVMAKDGGKIVKGEKKAVRPKKKTRIQIRGFGKARK